MYVLGLAPTTYRDILMHVYSELNPVVLLPEESAKGLA